jgi:hypothetical protein
MPSASRRTDCCPVQPPCCPWRSGTGMPVPAERARLKWLVYAAAVIVVVLLATILAEPVMGPGNASNNLENP